MRPRTCLITGANRGVGYATARALAVRGHHVGLLCRSWARGSEARDRIRQETGNPHIELVRCDLNTMSSVRHAAKEILDRYDAIHVLLHSASTLATAHQLTADGFERTMATDFLGPFLLTHLLLDRLVASAPARLIVLAGSSHRRATRDLSDLAYTRKPWDRWTAKHQAQLARVLFMREAARHLRDTDVTANAIHPGLVQTERTSQLPWLAQAIGRAALRPWLASPRQASRHVLRLALDPALARTSGVWFNGGRVGTPGAAVHDEVLAHRLWSSAERLTLHAGISPEAEAVSAQ